jgi:FHS family glucose/mannose:H+ symporter-like MFS transporter
VSAAVTSAERSYALGPILGMQAIEVLTGIGLTLLGSALPMLARLWHLGDGGCGRLLLAVFAGSALGPMILRPPFHRAVAWGMAMMAAGMAGLALSSGHLLFPLFLLFGTGLGVAMTANSLLTGERYPERRAAMLTLLNFSWSAGAAISPLAIHFILTRAGVQALFWSIGAAALLCTGLALLLPGPQIAGQTAPPSPSRTTRMSRSYGMLVFFSIFGLLYCGSEAALGGWVLTYVHRLGFQIAAAPPLTASCFWLSLLIGRAIAPALLLRVREETLLGISLTGAFAGVAGLLAFHALPAIIAAAAVTGLCFAPIFPICVSIFMTLAADATQARWMFAVAGVGSSTLPWLTGHLSARTGSLHAGLLVPLFAVAAMLAMLRWPGGGTDLFRRMFSQHTEPPFTPGGSGILPST